MIRIDQGKFEAFEIVGKDVADAWDVPYKGIVAANDTKMETRRQMVFKGP